MLEFAVSVTSSDPVMQGHVEQLAANWNGFEIGRGNMRVQWRDGVALRICQTADLPALRVRKEGGLSVVELTRD